MKGQDYTVYEEKEKEEWEEEGEKEKEEWEKERATRNNNIHVRPYGAEFNGIREKIHDHMFQSKLITNVELVSFYYGRSSNRGSIDGGVAKGGTACTTQYVSHGKCRLALDVSACEG